MQAHHPRRTYDYRIQEAICESGNRDLFPELNIPRSTIRSWIHRGAPDVVTCDLLVRDRADLLAEIRQYQQRTALLGAIVGLLIAMLRVSKVRLDYERLLEGESKRVLLRAIERAGKALPLSAISLIHRSLPPQLPAVATPKPSVVHHATMERAPTRRNQRGELANPSDPEEPELIQTDRLRRDS
jgi:hypothetical protein